jgi:hypothetical protein
MPAMVEILSEATYTSAGEVQEFVVTSGERRLAEILAAGGRVRRYGVLDLKTTIDLKTARSAVEPRLLGAGP